MTWIQNIDHLPHAKELQRVFELKEETANILIDNNTDANLSIQISDTYGLVLKELIYFEKRLKMVKVAEP